MELNKRVLIGGNQILNGRLIELKIEHYKAHFFSTSRERVRGKITCFLFNGSNYSGFFKGYSQNMNELTS